MQQLAAEGRRGAAMTPSTEASVLHHYVALAGYIQVVKGRDAASND